MKDSTSITPMGTATPYVAVFDSKGKPIKDPKSGLPIGALITSFVYVYEEEDDDTFELQIDTDNPDILDIPQLQTQMPLTLQWGYIYPDGSSHSGPTRKVVIRDHSIRFSDSGVKATIKGTDAFALTKVKPADLEDKTLVQWLKNNIQGTYTLEIVDYSVKNRLKSEIKQ